jgi:type IV secretion system protein VirD4
LIIRLGLFLGSLLIGCWSSTFLLLSKLPKSRLPKGEWFSFFDIKIYPPWMWIKWYYLYANQFNKIFSKTMWPIEISILVGICLAFISRFLFNKQKISIVHGSSKWASESDLLKAGIVASHGVVLGQSKERSKILRHDGPEHILAIAPTRGGKGVGFARNYLKIVSTCGYQRGLRALDSPETRDNADLPRASFSVGKQLCKV